MAIGRITKGATFKGSYYDGDRGGLNHKEEEFLDSNGVDIVLDHEGKPNLEIMVGSFVHNAEQNPDIKKPCLRFSLSYVPEDMLTMVNNQMEDEGKPKFDSIESAQQALGRMRVREIENNTMVRDTKDWMRKMGMDVDNTQYAIFRHDETGKPHVHIQINTVTLDGGHYETPFKDYKVSKGICIGITREHGYSEGKTVVMSERVQEEQSNARKIKPPFESNLAIVRREIVDSLSKPGVNSFDDLKAELAKRQLSLRYTLGEDGNVKFWSVGIMQGADGKPLNPAYRDRVYSFAAPKLDPSGNLNAERLNGFFEKKAHIMDVADGGKAAEQLNSYLKDLKDGAAFAEKTYGSYREWMPLTKEELAECDARRAELKSDMSQLGKLQHQLDMQLRKHSTITAKMVVGAFLSSGPAAACVLALLRVLDRALVQSRRNTVNRLFEQDRNAIRETYNKFKITEHPVENKSPKTWSDWWTTPLSKDEIKEANEASIEQIKEQSLSKSLSKGPQL